MYRISLEGYTGIGNSTCLQGGKRGDQKTGESGRGFFTLYPFISFDLSTMCMHYLIKKIK